MERVEFGFNNFLINATRYQKTQCSYKKLLQRMFFKSDNESGRIEITKLYLLEN